MMTISQIYRRIKSILLPLLVFGVFFFIIAYAAPVMEGVGKGITICIETIIPSLFVFMVLTSFLTNTELSYIISRPLYPITHYLLKLPDYLGCTVFMSMLGGYPVGAKMISQQYQSGTISRQQASRMLCFCCNPSPAFVISVVGMGMLGNIQAGFVLYGASVLSSLIIGTILGLKTDLPSAQSPDFKSQPFSSRVVSAINNALSATIIMCGFVLFFSAIVDVLVFLSNKIGLWDIIPFGNVAKIGIYGLLEVTLGCSECAAASPTIQAAVLPFLISFSGLSVIFQIIAMFGEQTDISFRPFLISRVSHGILTSLLSYPFLIKMLKVSLVYKLDASPVPAANANTLPVIILLAGMCCLLFLKIAQLQIDKENI